MIKQLTIGCAAFALASGSQAFILDDLSLYSDSFSLSESNPGARHFASMPLFGGSRAFIADIPPTSDSEVIGLVGNDAIYATQLDLDAQVRIRVAYGAVAFGQTGDFLFLDSTNLDLTGLQFGRLQYQVADGTAEVLMTIYSNGASAVYHNIVGSPGSGTLELQPVSIDPLVNLAEVDGIEFQFTNYLGGNPGAPLASFMKFDDLELVGAVPEPASMLAVTAGLLALMRRKRR